jgi:ribosomal protein S21
MIRMDSGSQEIEQCLGAFIWTSSRHKGLRLGPSNKRKKKKKEKRKKKSNTGYKTPIIPYQAKSHVEA